MAYPHSYGEGVHSRYGRQPLFGGAAQDDSVAVTVEPLSFDDEIDELRAGVRKLKHVSTTIHEESKVTGQLLDSLEQAMDAAKLTLRQTIKRLDRAYKQSKSNHMIYVFVFALGMFFMVFFWSKVVRIVKWVL